MDLASCFLALTLHGAGWVLWLLVSLSVVSVAIMLERFWYLRRHRLDSVVLAIDIRDLLARDHDRVVRAGEGASCQSRLAAAVEGAKAREKLRLERNLSFLATLGSNAPFIGLFGTVLGIIKAFHDLAHAQGGGPSVVMSGISEALVATAVGLMVAIPAVVAFNYFNRRVRVKMSDVEWMAHLAQVEVEAEIAEAAGDARLAAATVLRSKQAL
jgi:biopolymer transport protein ExbB